MGGIPPKAEHPQQAGRSPHRQVGDAGAFAAIRLGQGWQAVEQAGVALGTEIPGPDRAAEAGADLLSGTGGDAVAAVGLARPTRTRLAHQQPVSVEGDAAGILKPVDQNPLAIGGGGLCRGWQDAEESSRQGAHGQRRGWVLGFWGAGAGLSR